LSLVCPRCADGRDHPQSSDFDRLERLAERRGMLLDAATSMLLGAIRMGRGFDAREQSAWDYAAGVVEETGEEIDRLVGSLERHGYRFPRPVH
jgi:hypothetical protein